MANLNKNDTTIRIALLRAGTLSANFGASTPRCMSKQESQAVAIAARRAELGKGTSVFTAKPVSSHAKA